MNIGVISNTDSFIPFVYALAAQQLQVHIFFSPPKDPFVQQKAEAFAAQLKLPLTQERNPEKDLYQWLQKENCDVCFVLGYTHLIRLDRLKGCRTQLFNIHFGPLPGFRGPVPVFWQLKKGMAHVGLSIHKVTEKFDDGPVVWSKEIPNLPWYNYQAVNQALSQVCVEGVFLIVQSIINGMPVPEMPQAVPKPAYQKRPELQHVMIDWQQMNAAEICNLVRACNPWNKGAITFFKGMEVKLLDAAIAAPVSVLPEYQKPGTIIQNEEKLLVYCRDGQVISSNMLFFNDCFIPSYQCKYWGLLVGQQLG